VEVKKNGERHVGGSYLGGFTKDSREGKSKRERDWGKVRHASTDNGHMETRLPKRSRKVFRWEGKERGTIRYSGTGIRREVRRQGKNVIRGSVKDM